MGSFSSRCGLEYSYKENKLYMLIVGKKCPILLSLVIQDLTLVVSGLELCQENSKFNIGPCDLRLGAQL